MTVTWQSLLTAAAIAAAIIALWGYVARAVRFMDRQQKQDTDLASLRRHHDEDMQTIKAEQTILCYGVLACLKGLAEQGCDGPVHDAIDKLEKHLNKRAHE